MTETVVLQRKTVSADGFANPLNLPANVEDETHVSVYGDDELLTLSTDYTVDGAGDTGDLDAIAGVNIILEADVLLEGFTTYTVEHTPPLDQDVDLSSGGTLGRIYMAGLDAIVRRLQTVGAALGRRLVLPVDSSASPILPEPKARRALIWNAAGTAIINSLEDPDNPDTVDAAAFAAAAAAALASTLEAQTASETARDGAVAAQNAAEAAAAAAGDPELLAALATPVGTTTLHCQTTTPTGKLKENGAAVSRTAYSALFDVIGETFGAGDGVTTFNLPESRGEFFRALDDGRGIDTDRNIADAQSEMVGPHGHTASAASAGAHTHVQRATSSVFAQGANSTSGNANIAPQDTGDSTGSGGAHTHTITVNTNTGTENRPRNVARLACIQYLVYVPPEE